MSKLMKIIIGSLAVLALIVVLLVVPIFPDMSNEHLEKSVLLQDVRVGGIVGYDDNIQIFDDGKVKYNNEELRLSEPDLQKLKNFIKNKEYSISRTPSYIKFYPSKQIIVDAIYTSTLVNDGGRTYPINYNPFITELISTLEKEVRDKKSNMT